MKYKFIALLIFFLPVAARTQSNMRPLVSNLQIAVDWQQQSAVLTYDLSDPDDSEVAVAFYASSDGGKSYALTADIPAIGDLGSVSPGAGLQIICDLAAIAQMNGIYTFRLVADDGHPVNIQELVDAVNADRLCNDLHTIEGIRHRTGGPVHLEQTRNDLIQHFESLGLSSGIAPFAFGGYTGKNVIGFQPGTSEPGKVVINDAHYDTVINSPGADDNGSGVAGMLEISRILSPFPATRSLRYIGFDLEEEGLRGSSAYLTDPLFTADSVEGVFNFEMIGYYSEEPNTQDLPFGFNLLFPDAYQQVQNNQFKGDFITNVGNQALSVPLMNAFASAASTYVPDLKVISLATPNNAGLATDLWRSDHGAFWAAGKPALMITDGAEFRNDCYHTPLDTLENKLDCGFMSKVARATLAAMAELSGLKHGSWETIGFENTTGLQSPEDCKWAVQPGVGHRWYILDVGSCSTSPSFIEIFDVNGRLINAFIPDNALQIPFQGPLTKGVFMVRATAGAQIQIFKLAQF